MPIGSSLPLKRPGEDFTFKATAGVTAKRILRVSGNRTGGGHAALGTDLANVYQMAHCNGATQIPVGVAAYDVASGALGACQSGGIRTCTAGAAITAGELVMADANGKVIPYVGPIATNAAAVPDQPVPVGVAMTAAAADLDDAEIKLWI